MLQCRCMLRVRCISTVFSRFTTRFLVSVERPVLDDISAVEDSPVALDSVRKGALAIRRRDIRSTLDECANTDDVCAVFSEHRPHLQPSDLILLLSKIVDVNCRRTEASAPRHVPLWPPTVFCVIDLDDVEGKVNVMRLNSRVADMYSDVLCRLHSFSVIHLLYLVRLGLHIQGYQNKLLRSHSEVVISAGAWHLDAIDLCRCATVLAACSENVDFVKLIGHVSLSTFRNLNAYQRLLIFQSLSGARQGSTLFLQGAVRYALNPTIFIGNDVVTVLTCYVRRPSACTSAVLESLLGRASVLDLGLLDPVSLCNLIWATCKYSKTGSELLSRAEPLLTKHCPVLSAQNVSMLFWCMAECGYKASTLFSAVETAAINTSESMSPSNIAVCAHSIANLREVGSPSQFHDHVEDDIISHINHFNGLDLAMLAFGYCKLGLGSATMHQCIQECALRYAGDLPADCLSKLLWSYGRMGGRESFFSGLQFHVLERVNQFSTHELCRTLWAYAVMRYFDLGFWRNCLSMLLIEHVRDNRRCALLFPSLSEVTTVRKDFLNSDTLRLLNHTKCMFMDEESAQYCAKTGTAIIRALRLLGIEGSCRFDFKGFLLDCFFEHGDRQFAVLVYGNHNTVGSTFRPSGDMVLKARFLRRHGLNVLHVLREAFLDMSEEEGSKLLAKQMC